MRWILPVQHRLLSLSDGSMLLIVPAENRTIPISGITCRSLPAVMKRFAACRAFALQQGMRNGGGPACLRRCVALREVGLEAVNPSPLLTAESFARSMRGATGTTVAALPTRNFLSNAARHWMNWRRSLNLAPFILSNLPESTEKCPTPCN